MVPHIFTEKKKCALSIVFALVCFVFVFAKKSTAQNTIFAADCLQKTEAADGLLDLQNAQLSQIAQSSGDLFLVEKIEIRTIADELKDPRYQHTGRVSFNSIWEQDAQRKLNDWHLDEVAAEQLLRRHELRSAVYADLVDWANCQAEMALLEEQKQVLQDKITVLTKKATYGTEGNFSDLFKAKMTMEELDLELGDCQAKNRFFQKKFVTEQTETQLHTSDWMTPSEMLTRIRQSNGLMPQHPILERLLLRKKRTELRQNVELAKNKQRLDFVQLRYQNDNDEGIGRDYSLGFGFILPFRGSSNVKQFELKIDALEDERQYLEDRQKLQEKLNEIWAEAAFLEQRYQTVLQQMTASAQDPSIEKMRQAPDIDPLILLTLNSLQLERKARLLDIESDIRKLYTDWLEWSGMASMAAERSWLEGS